MKPYLTSFFLGIAATSLLSLFLFQKGCVSQKVIQHTTDTVYIDKPYKEIVIKQVEKPVKVFIYKTDTIYRKLIEKDTLITAVEITPWMAKVHTLTPIGISSVKEYPIMSYKKVLINHQGKISIKRPKHPRIRKRLGQVGLFVLGVFAASCL